MVDLWVVLFSTWLVYVHSVSENTAYYYHHGFFKWSDSFDKLNQRQPEQLQVVHVQQSHIQNQRRLTSHRYGECFSKEQGVQLTP